MSQDIRKFFLSSEKKKKRKQEERDEVRAVELNLAKESKKEDPFFDEFNSKPLQELDKKEKKSNSGRLSKQEATGLARNQKMPDRFFEEKTQSKVSESQTKSFQKSFFSTKVGSKKAQKDESNQKGKLEI